jgi:CheY-like chemotaxis protein
VCSYLAVPVISRAGAVLGGLLFGHPKPGVFTERDERLAVGIAAQAAVALERARLCQQVKAEAQLCRRLQGVFDHSQLGQGTVFAVEWPIESGGSAMPDFPGDDAHSSNSARTATILVIDDEPGIASALVHVLSRSGHTVETAANGRLALAKLAERAFDLILCDLRMPELDGPGFYQELARRYPQLLPRIIFLTGDTLSPEARAFLEKVGGARLHKPFRAAQVRQIVHQALQAL